MNGFFSEELVKLEEAGSAAVIRDFTLKPPNKPVCFMF
jgi:hypothetical protein